MTNKHRKFDLIAMSILASLLLLTSYYGDAQATVRIKDVAKLNGASSFKLIGYGLVVGLDRTGDSQKSIFTNQSLTNMLERFGIAVDGEKVRSKNVAAVIVTAEVAAFTKAGSKFDVTVSSLGDAKALQGGVLLQTPLADINGATWAVASGPIAIGGFNIETEMVSVRQNHPSVGRVPNGGVLNRDNPFILSDYSHLTYTLESGDFSSTLKMAESINSYFVDDLAYAADAVSVEIEVPDSLASAQRLVQFISILENLEFERSMPARVVINERTGTIVIGSHVSIAKVAISHGSLTIKVQSTPQVSQPSPFSKVGETAQSEQQDVSIDEAGTGGLVIFPTTSNVGDVAQALNRLGVTPRDIISIFQGAQGGWSITGGIGDNLMEFLPDIINTSAHKSQADPGTKRAKLEKACQDFEALFLAQMLKTMREAGFSDGKESTPMGLPANNPMQGMFDWHMAQDMSKRSPLGIAEELMRSLEPRLGNDDSDVQQVNEDPRSGYLKSIVDHAAEKHGVAPELIAAVIETESSGNRFTISKKGAKGLMQLMDETAKELNVTNPFDSKQNVEAGTSYLKKMIDRYDGDLKLALAAYNAGPGAVDKHGGIPPYKETTRYVEKVLNKYSEMK